MHETRLCFRRGFKRGKKNVSCPPPPATKSALAFSVFFLHDIKISDFGLLRPLFNKKFHHYWLLLESPPHTKFCIRLCCLTHDLWSSGSLLVWRYTEIYFFRRTSGLPDSSPIGIKWIDYYVNLRYFLQIEHIFFISYNSLLAVFFLISDYVCTQCNRSYGNKHVLIRHQRYQCGKEPQFKCPVCPHRGTLKSNVRKHLYRKHHSVADTYDYW